MWVHGGAFRHGSKDSGIAKLFSFARRGYVCVSVEYRLSGEAIWPAQIEDCKAAVRWLRAHAAEYRLDPDRERLRSPTRPRLSRLTHFCIDVAAGSGPERLAGRGFG